MRTAVGASPRAVRALRGSASATIAVLFAATAHTLSGGAAPPPWLVVAVAVLAAPLCTLLVGRRRRLLGLAAAVTLAQFALHAAFAAVGDAVPLVGGPHHHPAGGVPALAPAAHTMTLMETMTLGHALAAVVTTVVLAWGERVLAAIARGIRRLFARRAAPRATRPVGSVATLAPRPMTTSVILLCLSVRGPPARPAPAL